MCLACKEDLSSPPPHPPSSVLFCLIIHSETQRLHSSPTCQQLGFHLPVFLLILESPIGKEAMETMFEVVFDFCQISCDVVSLEVTCRHLFCLLMATWLVATTIETCWPMSRLNPNPRRVLVTANHVVNGFNPCVKRILLPVNYGSSCVRQQFVVFRYWSESSLWVWRCC